MEGHCMADQLKMPLPESLMKAIKAALTSPDLTPREKFEAAVYITNGYGLFLRAETIDPTGYAIPEEQWTEISQMLQDTSHRDGLDRVNAALDWMNIGPSGYKA